MRGQRCVLDELPALGGVQHPAGAVGQDRPAHEADVVDPLPGAGEEVAGRPGVRRPAGPARPDPRRPGRARPGGPARRRTGRSGAPGRSSPAPSRWCRPRGSARRGTAARRRARRRAGAPVGCCLSPSRRSVEGDLAEPVVGQVQGRALLAQAATHSVVPKDSSMLAPSTLHAAVGPTTVAVAPCGPGRARRGAPTHPARVAAVVPGGGLPQRHDAGPAVALLEHLDRLAHQQLGLGAAVQPATDRPDPSSRPRRGRPGGRTRRPRRGRGAPPGERPHGGDGDGRPRGSRQLLDPEPGGVRQHDGRRRRRSSRRRPARPRPTRRRRGRTRSTWGGRRPGWPAAPTPMCVSIIEPTMLPMPWARARSSSVVATDSPPHLASLTLTRSAARRRITSTRSRTPYTDSSAITGVETRAVTQASPSRSAAGTGCSTSSTSRSASSRASITRTASRARPALVGVQAQPHVRPDGLADRADPRHVGGGVGADLHLEDREPVGGPGPGGVGQRVRLAGRQGHVGRDPQRGAAEQHRQADAAAAGGQVVQRDVDRRLGAVVGGDGARRRRGRGRPGRPGRGRSRPRSAVPRRRPGRRPATRR